jgi:MoaA/NifB/PqqE/SkfB family radical SAM enzyme
MIDVRQTMENKISTPQTCLLTVSNRCHLKCKMCELWKKDTQESEISIEDAKRFIASLEKNSNAPVEVHLIGGETLVKEGIFDLIAYIRSFGARVVVTTSGYPITEDIARKIASCKLSMINFSLESLRSETHDFLRGVEGIHEKVMKAIAYVHRYAPQTTIGINTILSKQSMPDVVALVEWVQKNPCIESIYFMAVMRPFGSDLPFTWQDSPQGHLLWPSSDDSETVINALMVLKKMEHSKIGNSLGQFEIFKRYFKNPSSFVKTTGCSLAYHALNVNALGNAYLCFFMEKLGNIKEQSADQLWNSPKASEVRKRMSMCHQNCELIVNCYYEDEPHS